MSISIGIVGCGRFSPGFISLFRDHPEVSRVALCDTLPERVASRLEQFGLSEGYSSLDEICRTDLDAIVILTQPWLHAPQAVEVMKSGKHVYSAVPLIMLPDGDEMLEWCDRIINTTLSTGMTYMLGETSYYYPGAMFCRQKAKEGAFGQFVYATGCYFHDYQIPHSHLENITKHRWQDKWDMSKSGCIPLHYPTHSIGGFLSVVGQRAVKISGMGFKYPNDEWWRLDNMWKNEFSNEVANMRLSNGMIARIAEFRRIAGPCYEGFQLYGTHGNFIEIEEGHAYWANRHDLKYAPLSHEDMIVEKLPPEVLESFVPNGDLGSAYGGHQGSHPHLVHEFVDSIVHNRRPKIDAWQAARYLAPAVMAHKSAQRDGEWLDVPDWGDGPAA